MASRLWNQPLPGIQTVISAVRATLECGPAIHLESTYFVYLLQRLDGSHELEGVMARMVSTNIGLEGTFLNQDTRSMVEQSKVGIARLAVDGALVLEYEDMLTEEQGEPPPVNSQQTSSAGTGPTPTAKHTGPSFNHKNIFAALQDENAAIQSQDPSESSQGWITSKKRHREKQTADPHELHNSSSEQIKLYRDCNTHFTLSDETKAWFHVRGLQPPAR